MMSEPIHPIVFVSHASEDKDRFVVAFATHLRKRGIDAWLDKWEIAPGDSLVDKIFEEGLKNAQAVIVVISAASVKKAWVREELNASVVARIQKGTRLIPVLIDDVAVPEALKNTVWIKVADLDNFDAELDSIVAAILGTKSKPPLGPLPTFVNSTIEIPGLQKQDVAVLRLFCGAALEKDSLIVQTESMANAAAELRIQREQFLESTEILAERYLLEKSRALAPISPWFSVTTAGMDAYLHACMPDYRNVYASIASLIVNENKVTGQEIASALGHEKLLLVEHVLDVMSSNQLLKISKATSRHTQVYNVSPRLKRLLHDGGG